MPVINIIFEKLYIIIRRIRAIEIISVLNLRPPRVSANGAPATIERECSKKSFPRFLHVVLTAVGLRNQTVATLDR